MVDCSGVSVTVKSNEGDALNQKYAAVTCA